jgi:hypothetical protein
MKESCPSAFLERYFDGEVTGEEKLLVEDHLSYCQTCQGALKSMEGLRLLIKTPVDEIEQTENFYWVWRKIEKEVQSKEKPALKESIRRWLDLAPLLRKRIWVPAVAAVVAIFLALTPFLLQKAPSSSDLSVVEYVESQSYNVMIYELEKGNVTVIWLLEGPETEGLSKS